MFEIKTGIFNINCSEEMSGFMYTDNQSFWIGYDSKKRGEVSEKLSKELAELINYLETVHSNEWKMDDIVQSIWNYVVAAQGGRLRKGDTVSKYFDENISRNQSYIDFLPTIKKFYNLDYCLEK